MSEYIDYIDINELIRIEKKKYPKETVEKTKEIIHNSLMKGIEFKNKLIEITTVAYHNHLIDKPGIWYYFKCPVCENRARKIYISNYKRVGCRTCLKISSKTRVVTNSDRVFKIQHYLSEIFTNKNITSKKRNKYLKNIIDHYNQLDSSYKTAYNTFVFTGLQNWCLVAICDNTKSKEYHNAIRDVLKRLRDIKKILIETKTSNFK